MYTFSLVITTPLPRMTDCVCLLACLRACVCTFHPLVWEKKKRTRFCTYVRVLNSSARNSQVALQRRCIQNDQNKKKGQTKPGRPPRAKREAWLKLRTVKKVKAVLQKRRASGQALDIYIHMHVYSFEYM